METVAEPPKFSPDRMRVRSWLDRIGRWQPHGWGAVCPVCNLDVTSTTGITKLAYTLEVCTCRAVSDVQHDHLVEQLWHRACLFESDGELPDGWRAEHQMQWPYMLERSE